MRWKLTALGILLVTLSSPARSAPDFKEHFIDRAMRLDCSFTGDAKGERVTLDRVVEEGAWPETTTHLLDPFNNGKYVVELYDVATNGLIYSRGFDSMFAEYTTTAPALAGVERTFSRSIRVPFPRAPVLFVIERRGRDNLPAPIFRRRIDPAADPIVRETPDCGDTTFTVIRNGDPRHTVDLAFLAEGYRAADLDKFKADVARVAGWLFEVEPYKSARDRFNVYGVMRPSVEDGVDEPRQGVYRRTALNASFDAFGTDRYLLTDEGRRLREMAAQVPYDAIVILVNSNRYGGGGIYDDYCITTVDNERSRSVFLHEFGHAFAGLADEYYSSDVAYNDFYPRGVEPLEPNITEDLDPSQLKWRDLVAPGIALPTPWGKDRIDALEAERHKDAEALQAELDEAKGKGLSEAETAKIKARYAKRTEAVEAKLARVREEYAGLAGKVGLFEGAGYASKGLYRPSLACIMFSSSTGSFCAVCRRAIQRMIDYYSDGSKPQ